MKEVKDVSKVIHLFSGLWTWILKTFPLSHVTNWL